MAKRTAAPARSTKTAASRGGARKSAARRPAARKSSTKKAKAAAKSAKKSVRKAAKPAGRIRATKKATRPTARSAKKATRKVAARRAPARSAKAPARRPAAPAAATRARKTAPRTAPRKPALDRDRRRVVDEDIIAATPPSSLDLDRHATAARTGAAELGERLEEHTETSPAITGGDVDADWQSAYSVGDEAPGGDNPTPDQDIVDDIGKALGVEYQDNEELKGSDKIVERDKHRWELDPASSDDWNDR